MRKQKLNIYDSFLAPACRMVDTFAMYRFLTQQYHAWLLLEMFEDEDASDSLRIAAADALCDHITELESYELHKLESADYRYESDRFQYCVVGLAQAARNVLWCRRELAAPAGFVA